MRKSADALAKAGYVVHVLYAFTTDWATSADVGILQNAGWSFERVGGDPHTARLQYLLTRLSRKISEALGRNESGLCRALAAYVKRGLEWKPDVIIGHNPGSLGPVFRISEKLKIPALFDAEDYHRGEAVQSDPAMGRIIKLEDKVLGRLTHITAASPLIADAYRALYPKLQIRTVNNAFPLRHLSKEPSASNQSPLSIVWFSQVVGLDRGLREFLECLQYIPHIPIDLDLLGLASDQVKNKITQLPLGPNHRIQFHPTQPENELFKFVARHEIGLALEIGKPLNRDLCRTNKLYTYPLAGCYTVAAQTKSQIQFFKEFPDAGQLINLEQPESIAYVLSGFFEHRQELLEKRKKAWLLAKKSLNWERESENLISFVESQLPE